MLPKFIAISRDGVSVTWTDKFGARSPQESGLPIGFRPVHPVAGEANFMPRIPQTRLAFYESR
jgi:hypothetical protein